MKVGPNVAVVVLDTARATDALSTAPTVMPNLLSLADEGTLFENAFTSAPWTLPAHASLFTGTYPSKHGAHGEHTYLDDSHQTVAEAFAAEGYETLAVSNNTWVDGEFGFDRGFETFWKGWQYLQSETHLAPLPRGVGYAQTAREVADRLSGGNPLVNAVNLCYSELIQSRGDDGASRTTDRVASWLDHRSNDRPFFLFVNYIEPHIEYRPPREYAERFLPRDATFEEAQAVRQDPCAYNVGRYTLTDRECTLLRGLYRGELAYVDDALGRLCEALRAEGEWEDTILMVLGDHGENIGERGFLGHQYDISDFLLHVPLVVSGGEFDDAGSDPERLVQVPDIVPTLLDSTGLDAPDLRAQSQGRSFHPAAAGGRERVFAEYIAPKPPLETLEDRFEDLPEYAYDYDRTLRVIRTDDYKFVRGSDGREELYRIGDSPIEGNDRSDAEPRRAEELREQLDEWLATFTHASPSTDVTVTGSTKERLSDLGYM